MLKYTIRRLILLVPVLAGVALLVFTLLYITPGDPARMALGEDAPQEAVEQFRKNYGLDDPFFVSSGATATRRCSTATSAIPTLRSRR